VRPVAAAGAAVLLAFATYDVVPTTGTYTYEVRAINSVNNGPWSGSQSFTVTQ
jgi:hypothetical protein